MIELLTKMEENVALDSNKQKKFVKSIKGIKKLIKKSEAIPQDSVKLASEDAKSKKPRYKQKGLVYLSHIPHGFYENEMTQYFKQFGKVTNARVIRSKRTGNSKGYAFVEFGEPAVAQIVAETMNNYLMGKRLIKAAYVPPEKQRRHALRKHWSVLYNPGTQLRSKLKKQFNENKTDQQELTKAKKLLKNLTHTKTKLKAQDINYDFFQPVDVPEALRSALPNSEVTTSLATTDSMKLKKSVAPDKVEEQTKPKKRYEKKNDVNAENVKQKGQKQHQMKAAGVRPPENFVSVAQSESDESNSAGVDSDECEKSLEVDSDLDSEGGGSEEDASSEEDPPPPPKKGPLKNKAAKAKGVALPPLPRPDSKRKAPQKAATTAKKQTFAKKGTQSKRCKRK